ncbi:2-oxo acid dehydrogenase subunit E2 [Alkalicoccus saliphilus]|uniref:Dihydrolipoamide acetyltransferase component of pyruvate dehydrogenase complex n=1 Tax=Alkalicoccus saliphilus TaxID=200989 RepID=A0A2T4U4N8_9BACI|nr:2-oxo acid dehydrogenase subunit E2 [Alkalicoccus saliphilus]PTL38367.1 branched-chain alpha-keto acid dehydrogenase subunit E2 [Alkalicoccus saliphilus]
MASEVLMPKLGAQMEEGTIVSWLVELGEFIEKGDPLVEIQTDKVTMEVEAEHEGHLIKIIFEENEAVPVHTPIAYIGEKGEKVKAKVEGSQNKEEEKQQSNVKTPRTPLARKIAEEENISLDQVTGTGPNGRIQKKDILIYQSEKEAKPAKRATPLAKKVAEKQNIDINEVEGSGHYGKVNKEDVLTLSSNSPADTSQERSEMVKPIKGLRRAIAESMKKSAFEAPHVTLYSEIDMTEAVQLRNMLLPLIEEKEKVRISFNDIILKAVGDTLHKHPGMNISFNKDQITYHEKVNIGMAVAIEDGLVVPVIRNITNKTLSDITKETKDLGRRAIVHQLKGEEMKGSTFTVSNLGKYAVDHFNPIINQPNAAILGIGQISKKPAVKQGEVTVRSIMGVSLSFDHRALDGAPAAAFLSDVKRLLEDPFKLLI